MFGADALTFQEFIMREPLPLATLHSASLEFLQGREDVVVFGAQAVNAYVDEPRMTQDIDLVSTRADALAEELRSFLSERFHIAVRIRQAGRGRGYRIFQVRKEGNRHIADLLQVDSLPEAQSIAGVLVLAPAALIASKVIAYRRRRGQPKSGTDWRDVAMLLLRFPELKNEAGPVRRELESAGASDAEFDAWRDLVGQEIRLPEEDEEF